jgi:hypothetical protein
MAPQNLTKEKIRKKMDEKIWSKADSAAETLVGKLKSYYEFEKEHWEFLPAYITIWPVLFAAASILEPSYGLSHFQSLSQFSYVFLLSFALYYYSHSKEGKETIRDQARGVIYGLKNLVLATSSALNPAYKATSAVVNTVTSPFAGRLWLISGLIVLVPLHLAVSQFTSALIPQTLQTSFYYFAFKNSVLILLTAITMMSVGVIERELFIFSCTYTYGKETLLKLVFAFATLTLIISAVILAGNPEVSLVLEAGKQTLRIL